MNTPAEYLGLKASSFGARSRSLDKARQRRLDFEDFYASHFDKVLKATFAFHGHYENALEATQEAFGRALVRWKRISRQGWAEGWVMTTAFNLCRRNVLQSLRQDQAARKSGPPRQLLQESPIERVDILEAIRRLPRRRREATVLFYIGDLPIQVVAQQMRLSEGAVKRHLSIAREDLRDQLQSTYGRRLTGRKI